MSTSASITVKNVDGVYNCTHDGYIIPLLEAIIDDAKEMEKINPDLSFEDCIHHILVKREHFSFSEIGGFVPMYEYEISKKYIKLII